MKVYTAFATIRRDGQTIGPIDVQIIEDENGLRAVLDTDDDGSPTVLAVLNPRYFQHPTDAGLAVYELPISWPSGAIGAG